LAKTIYFAKGADYQTRGFQINLSGGYKLCEALAAKGTKNNFLHSAQGTVDIRLLIPLYKDAETSSSLAGLLQLKCGALGLLTHSQGLDSLFKDNPKINFINSNFIFAANAEINLNIIDEFAFAIGGNGNLPKTFAKGVYFKFIYNRK